MFFRFSKLIKNKYTKNKIKLLNNNTFRKIHCLISKNICKNYFPACLTLILVFITILTFTVASQQNAVKAQQEKKPAITRDQFNNNQVSRGTINRSDFELMAQVIEGEAAGEPYIGKLAVGAVIVNRLESDEFPNDLIKVIYQPNAFEAVSNGQYKRKTSQDSYKAAEEALKGKDPTNGCLYYWNPKTAKSKWVWQRPVIMQIGRHVFAK